VQQDLLVFAGLGDAPCADFYSVARRQHHVHYAQLFEFLKDTTRFVAKAAFAAQTGQGLPQHVGQKANQNVRF